MKNLKISSLAAISALLMSFNIATAEPIDCTNLVGSPKNLGQLNKFVRETGYLSGKNVPTDAREAGVPVDDWIKEQVFSVCTNGPGNAADAANTENPS